MLLCLIPTQQFGRLLCGLPKEEAMQKLLHYRSALRDLPPDVRHIRGIDGTVAENLRRMSDGERKKDSQYFSAQILITQYLFDI